MLKFDRDSVYVTLEQSSRTILNSVNVIQINFADACWQCIDYYTFALLSEEQCGRDGWECTSSGSVNVTFKDISLD